MAGRNEGCEGNVALLKALQVLPVRSSRAASSVVSHNLVAGREGCKYDSAYPAADIIQVTGIKNPNTGMRSLYGKLSVRV